MTLVLCLGCGPEKVLPPPDEMPKALDTRTLWHTPRAYIYATHKPVAGEIDRCVKEVADYVKETHEGELGKGLVIVIDKGEEDILDGRLRKKLNLNDMKAPKEKEQPTPEHSVAASAMRPPTILIPAPLDEEALSDLGLKGKLPEDVAWSLVCPSHRQMEHVMYDNAMKELKKENKLAAVGAAGFVPLITSTMAKLFLVFREMALYIPWSERQTQWSAERRSKEAARFATKRMFHHVPMMRMFMKVDEEGIMTPQKNTSNWARRWETAKMGKGPTKPNDRGATPPPEDIRSSPTSQPALKKME